jgi:hypothetical protein
MTKPTNKLQYGDVCKVKSGFYKDCLVRVLRCRLFGLIYKITIVHPYFGAEPARILGFRLDIHKKANKES